MALLGFWIPLISKDILSIPIKNISVELEDTDGAVDTQYIEGEDFQTWLNSDGAIPFEVALHFTNTFGDVNATLEIIEYDGESFQCTVFDNDTNLKKEGANSASIIYRVLKLSFDDLSATVLRDGVSVILNLYPVKPKNGSTFKWRSEEEIIALNSSLSNIMNVTTTENAYADGIFSLPTYYAAKKIQAEGSNPLFGDYIYMPPGIVNGTCTIVTPLHSDKIIIGEGVAVIHTLKDGVINFAPIFLRPRAVPPVDIDIWDGPVPIESTGYVYSLPNVGQGAENYVHIDPNKDERLSLADLKASDFTSQLYFSGPAPVPGNRATTLLQDDLSMYIWVDCDFDMSSDEEPSPAPTSTRHWIKLNDRWYEIPIIDDVNHSQKSEYIFPALGYAKVDNSGFTCLPNSDSGTDMLLGKDYYNLKIDWSGALFTLTDFGHGIPFTEIMQFDWMKVGNEAYIVVEGHKQGGIANYTIARISASNVTHVTPNEYNYPIYGTITANVMAAEIGGNEAEIDLRQYFDILVQDEDPNEPQPEPIATISTGYIHTNEVKNMIIKLQDKEVTQNGEYTADAGFDGLAKVTVNVEGGGSGGLPDGVNVTFKSDGQDYMLMSVLSGNSVPAPVTPEKEGEYFFGWSAEEQSNKLQQFPFEPLEDMTLYAQWKSKVVIGFTGLTNESGELTWTDDIANFEKWSTSVSGGNIIVTSPLDNIFPFSEIHEVTDDGGNVFVSFPKMYMKWITDSSGNIDGVKFSNEAIDDDSFISDAFLDPRNNGEYLDEVLIGKYEASGSSSKIFSKSKATCLVSVTRDGFRKAARAYGDSDNAYNGYQQYDIAMLTLYNFLCMLYYKTANIQTVFAGRTSEDSKSDTGTCDTISGLNGWGTGTNCVKMLGVENPYGNINKWVDGIVFSGTTIYAQKLPTEYTDSTGGNTFGFSRPTSSGYIKYLRAGSDATKSLVYCSSTGGDSDTYVGDKCYCGSSGTVLALGGRWDRGADAGLWCLDGSNGASGSYSAYGGRLCRRPLK